MNEQEIKQGNILIAKFMGCSKSEYVSSIYIMDYMADKPHYIPSLMQYHSDWSWLMPVGLKIINIQDDFRKLKTKEQANKYMESSCYFGAVKKAAMSFNITILFKAVVEFIKWYNYQKSLT